MNKKVLIAAGGSGGHLLPAQKLAQLLKNNAEVFFAGSGLSKNPFFQQGERVFKDIASSPLSRPLQFLYRTPLGLPWGMRM